MSARLGDYELEAEIGRGGMGRVYRARHVRTGAVRAVKTLEQAGDVESVLRFQREAEALARVGGAVAVPIHESGTERGRFYFVMDLMPGGSLRERAERGGRLPWREAVALGTKLATGLAVLHDHGLVHRDLKPANILFGDDGAPRIADLGCVRDISSNSLTASGTLLGTLGYMAPEQLRGERAGPPADVFALAVILHELIAGAPLFEGSPMRQLTQRSEVGKRPRLETIAGAPRALDAVLDSALALDEKARPDARELARLLETVTTASKPGAPGRVLGLVGVVLAVAGLLGFLGSRPASEPSPKASPVPSPAASTPTPTSSPRESVLARLGGLVNRKRPITSADVPLADLDVAIKAGRVDLLNGLALNGALYSLTDLEARRPSDPGDPVAGPLRTLWAYSAIASGDPRLRVAARNALKGATGLNGDLVDEMARVDRIAATLARARTAEPTGNTEGSLAQGPALAEQLPRPVFAGLLAPLLPVCREEALDAVVRRFRGDSGPADGYVSFLSDLFRPFYDALPPVLRLDLAIMTMGLIRRLLANEPAVVTRWSGTSWTIAHKAESMLASNQRLFVAGYRRYGEELEATATSLEKDDPLLAAAARCYGLNLRALGEMYADHFEGHELDTRLEHALDDLLRRRWDSPGELAVATAIAHDFHRTLGWYLAERAASTAPGDERNRLASRSLAEMRAAIEALPLRPPGPFEMRTFDAHDTLRALFLSPGQIDDAEVATLEGWLDEQDWLHCEALRRRKEFDAAIKRASTLENPIGDKHANYGDNLVCVIAVRALARIDLGTDLDKAAADIAVLRTIVPGGLQLPDLRPDALQKQLDDARAAQGH